MAKKTNQKFSTKNIVILTALALALVGYFGYRSLLTSPDINLIGSGEGGSQYSPRLDPNGMPTKKTFLMLNGKVESVVSSVNAYLSRRGPASSPYPPSTKSKEQKKDEAEQSSEDKNDGGGRGPNTGETGRYDTK